MPECHITPFCLAAVELSPGKHTFTALCRDVTRTGIREGSSDVTLELKPGGIYQLDADFKAPSNRCDVRGKLLAPWSSRKRTRNLFDFTSDVVSERSSVGKNLAPDIPCSFYSGR
jgi:hypothetical protein